MAQIPEIQTIARQGFPIVWKAEEFAYFLQNSSGLCLGVFSPPPQGLPRLVGYFLSLVVFGDMDIISVATHEEFRRQGIAQALIRAACASPIVTRAFLEVDVSNESAIHLYRSLGFVVHGLRKRYYEQKRDALVMRWDKLRPTVAGP